NILPENPQASGTRFLLLVEDSDVDVLFIRRAIDQTKVDLPLSVAKNGVEAMDYIAGRKPFSDRKLYPPAQLMLLDLRMPKRSGLEVLEWMKKEGIKSPKAIV